MNPENPDGGAEEGSMNQVSLACGPCWVGSRAGRLDLEAVSAENTHLGLKQDSPPPPPRAGSPLLAHVDVHLWAV